MTTTSLLDRAGLDKPKAAKIIGRGLAGADDGELFLEYRQSEMLLFDNGRLKQGTYDTAQGFGLRAVKGEAVGYAHGGQERENLEVVRRILDLTGASPDLVRHVEDRPGHDRRYSVDSSKVRALGWTPKHSF